MALNSTWKVKDEEMLLIFLTLNSKTQKNWNATLGNNGSIVVRGKITLEMSTWRKQLQGGWGSLRPLPSSSQHKGHHPWSSPITWQLWKYEFGIFVEKAMLSVIGTIWFNYISDIRKGRFQFNVTQINSLNKFLLSYKLS